METRITDQEHSRDDFGVAGKACEVEIDGEKRPGIIRESRRETDDHIRVVVDVDGKAELLDTAHTRVEVLGR